jgi:hypothetical protein
MGRDVVMGDAISEVFNSATSTPVPRGMVNTFEMLSRIGVGVGEMRGKSWMNLKGISEYAAVWAL